MHEIISTEQQVLLEKITRLATEIKTGVARCKYHFKQSPYSGKFFLQKIAYPVAAHPIKVDKSGGEIAKLVTSSHKKAVKTSEESISSKMLVIRTPF